jgi:cytochrome c oxidase subunit 2
MTISSFINYFIASADAPKAWQFGFQDPATPVMEGIINLHHDVMFFCILIVVFVCWMLARTVIHFHEDVETSWRTNQVHGTVLEIVWTIVPAAILVLIALPSFALLYAIDEPVDPQVTIKAIGHQWYWTYEYTDYQTENGDPIIFDSYMIPESDLEKGQLRLLEVDNKVVVPVQKHIRVLITAADVLHCWAVPALGVKMDACPGRLNQISMYIQREGTYYGQCSEICGVNHGFMPICVEAVSTDKYIDWVSEKITSNDWIKV